MKNMTRAVVTLALLLLFVGCDNKRNKDNNPNGGEQTKVELPTPLFRNASTDSHEKLAEKYLGRGFNLLNYSSKDETGYTRGSVLDSERLKSGEAWQPFENIEAKPNVSGNAPLFMFKKSDEKDAKEEFKALSNVWFESEYTFKPMLRQKELKLTGVYNGAREKDDIEHYSYGLYAEKGELAIILPQEQLVYFLDVDFVKDLKQRSATDLVRQYGTHVITDLEVAQMLEVHAEVRGKEFNLEQMRSLLSGYFGKKVSDDLLQKAGKDKQLKLTLTATGTASEKELQGLNKELWQSKQEEGKYAITSFMPAGSDQVAIPDLIHDPFLRTKYIMGIVTEQQKLEQKLLGTEPQMVEYELWSASLEQMNYIRDIPSDAQEIKAVGLKDFRNSRDAVLKIETGKVLVPDGRQLKEVESAQDTWQLELQPSGLWTIRSKQSGLYLCSDLRLRLETEDVYEHRFFYLNPILPGVGPLLVK